MLRRGELVTPLVMSGILESITRASLLALAPTLGLEAQEREIDRTERYVADELFFCGSAAEVTPILAVDRHTVGNGAAGLRTLDLCEAFLAVAGGQVPDERGWLTPVFGSQPVSVSSATATAAAVRLATT